MKICTQCKKEKKLCEFVKDSSRKTGYKNICKLCQKINIYNYYKLYPWKKIFTKIKERCYNKNCERYENYGGIGIECLITEEELKFLWFRDKAYLMDKPSIDRKDNNGNYILENCQFIEYTDNTIKAHEVKIIQFSLNFEFIKGWDSLKQIEKELSIYHGNISACCQRKYKQSHGFIWRYKNEIMSSTG